MSCFIIRILTFYWQSMGIVRPPIFTQGDGHRGLPAFLSNMFSGNARQELLVGLEHFHLLTTDEVIRAADSWGDFEQAKECQLPWHWNEGIKAGNVYIGLNQSKNWTSFQSEGAELSPWFNSSCLKNLKQIYACTYCIIKQLTNSYK